MDEESTNDSSDSDDGININDLDIGPSDIDVSSYYRDWNITTDQDELVNVAEHEIKLRGYQMKLAKQGCEGDNVIIMAPTNSGKTKVACKIVHTVLRNCEGQGKEGKAAFIVEREDLAIQQGKVFCEELPGYRTKVVTGDVQQSRDQYLKDFISR
ncbi:interferon-induced helicase C domain-containing protein 1-like [Ruditapes philippinarum]|uniref:interferon-induced helicase C domain-containing protein 1-like n=1 Tax=Ruditapes philippinarum TaxID=129788 RepID=UPI00295A8F07|nr:interferon-induced helicase C domain-containing protein 1-like [Ruditapes philippinarum]